MERKMMPIAPLMIEHRVIERMIKVIGKELSRVELTGEIDPGFIDVAVDFIRTYTDHCHHGKEENILFKALQNKPLPDDLKTILNELIDEHRKGRQVVAELVEAKEAYILGKRESIPKLIDCMRYLVDFYPVHIEKEDQHFFLPCMRFFNQEEKDAILSEEYDFDRNLVHSKYKGILEKAEAMTIPARA